MKLESLQDVLEEQLNDLYSAEQQLVKALPKIAEAVSNPELQKAINNHLKETEEHVARLEDVFEVAGIKPGDEECKAMKGLIAEGEEVIEASGSGDAKDAALIAAAQRVEHYEIAAYGTARTISQQLGINDAAKKLQETLDEESKANELLTQIAEKKVNVGARS
ncbi:MAG: ferritin-like domain-containing protein [Actinomycetota bacterium]|nr:ferritin-like domain-containing protein [Actinomycetota bacterium]